MNLYKFRCTRCDHLFQSMSVNKGTATTKDVIETPRLDENGQQAFDGVGNPIVDTTYENPIDWDFVWSKCPKCGERVRKEV